MSEWESTAPVGIDAVPAPAADVKVEVIEGEVLLYHPGQTKAVYLNPSASVIWSLCDGNRTVKEIIRLIGESYPDAGAAVIDDVLTTLTELFDNGLVVVVR